MSKTVDESIGIPKKYFLLLNSNSSIPNFCDKSRLNSINQPHYMDTKRCLSCIPSCLQEVNTVTLSNKKKITRIAIFYSKVVLEIIAL